MGCTTSHDAFAAAASRARRRATGHTSSSSASRRERAAVCRERAALIRAAADSRFALAAAHAAYFRSLAAVGGALRRFAAAALLPADPDDHVSPVLTLPPSPAKPVANTSTLPPSPSGSSSTVSPLSHSLSDDSDDDDEDLHALDHSRRFRPRKAPPPQPATQQHRHYMRNSATVPNAEYAEAQTDYGYPYGPPYRRPSKGLSAGPKGEASEVKLQSKESTGTANGDRDVMEAMDEINGRFEEAADYGDDVSKLLEVGKLPHRATPKVLRYSSSTVSSSHCLPRRQRNSILPSSTSASSSNLRRNPDLNLSSTLEKLCLWEMKLYQEVKDGVKMRILYEKKYKRLKLLDERGAQPEAIDSTRLLVRDLRQRISINIRTANAFSSEIEKIRDEELYPQLVSLIQGLRRMWKAVLECHERQLSAIRDSRIHLLKAMTISQSSAAATATLELERELSKWYRCFNKWMSTQRAYVEALNGWLRKWFPEVQEEQDAPDGAPPFSPGKLGAKPIFVISNDWFRAIELVPKNDTLESIDYFSKLVHEFRRSQEDEHRQRRRANHASRDYKRKREVLQRELGMSTGGTDMVAVMEHAPPSHDDRMFELEKMRKRRDGERARHEELMKHAHFLAAATLPVGFIPLLEQMVGFFQGSLQWRW